MNLLGVIAGSVVPGARRARGRRRWGRPRRRRAPRASLSPLHSVAARAVGRGSPCRRSSESRTRPPRRSAPSEQEEVEGAQAHISSSAAENGAERRLEQRPLEVGERDVPIDGQPLDLMELRGVRRVGVGPVDAPGDHDVQRRRVQFHGALPSAGRARCASCRAGPFVVLSDVEGVRARPRGVRGAVVERVEVVVHALDLRPLHDGEAEAEKDVFEFAAGGGERRAGEPKTPLAAALRAA